MSEKKTREPRDKSEEGNGKLRTAGKIIGVVAVIIVIIIGVLIVLDSTQDEYEERSSGDSGFFWKSKSEVVEDMSFSLGVRGEKDIQFYGNIYGDSETSNVYEITLDSSGDVVLKIFGYDPDKNEWILLEKNDGVSYTTEQLGAFELKSYSEFDVRVFNTSINVFTSKDVNIKIVHKWEEKIYE